MTRSPCRRLAAKAQRDSSSNPFAARSTRRTLVVAAHGCIAVSLAFATACSSKSAATGASSDTGGAFGTGSAASLGGSGNLGNGGAGVGGINAGGAPAGGVSGGQNAGGANGGGAGATAPGGAGGAVSSGGNSGSATGGAPASTGDGGPPDVFATSNGKVDVFVNGALVGSTTNPGALLSTFARFIVGQENLVVLRATSAGSGAPFMQAELDGVFGKAGSSAQWKVKAAQGSEATDPTGAWATTNYDDSAWAKATDTGVAPVAPFPANGPARGIWTASTADSVVLARLTLYVPANWSPNAPQGFGNGVTGGEGGETVTVSTTADLAAAVQGSTPRIVQVAGVIDFTGTEGTITAAACYQMQCPAPMQSEYITNQLGACTSSGMAIANFTYDKAGTTPLAVGSNKTIIGVGAGSTIKGKGFTLKNGSENVVIRNLTISAINPQLVWGGDAITIDDGDKVWIDHVRFSLIGRQMLVTGYGKASNVTLSWNEFDGRTPYSAYCNGTHYWVMLILGAADTITMSDNWIHDTSGRAPHAGGMMNATNTIHLVNDFYDYVPGHAVNPITTYAKVLAEGTYFRQVTTPFMIDTTTAPAPGHAYAPLDGTLATTTSSCQAALGRACVANVATPENGTFPLDTAALTAADFSTPGALVTPFAANHVPNVVPHLAGPGHI